MPSWLGARRVAFVPTINTRVDVNPPSDFVEQVQRRVYYDPDPATGVDRSLRSYIHAVSYGRAGLEGPVFPTVEAPDDDTRTAAANSLPANHDYEYLCFVLPTGGTHRTGFAWMNESNPINGFRNFARVNLTEGPGVWAMEVLHMTTWFGDLYNVQPNLGPFDTMACSCGTHLSAHTKLEIQWLDQGAVQLHRGTESRANLHAIALLQPPPAGRVAAVRIPSRTTEGVYFLVEARLSLDPYDRASSASIGLPSEGVIVYEVRSQLMVFLRTVVALSVGQSFVAPEEGIEVLVESAILGGFSVRIRSSEHPNCATLRERIAQVSETLDAMDPADPGYKQVLTRLRTLQAQANELGCE